MVGGFISTNCVDGLANEGMVDDNRRYEFISMACKFAGGPEGWLVPTPRATSYNDLALKVYNHLRTNQKGPATFIQDNGF